MSKAPLAPGSEIRPYVADDSWLIQKHRETLLDYVDVDVEEKEYITAWDAYILKEHISSGQFLPRAFLSFVREKAAWLLAKPCRAEEFAKHILVLYTRSTLDESTMNAALRILDEVRENPPAKNLEGPPERNHSNGCAVCGKLVAGPSTLICSELVCPAMCCCYVLRFPLFLYLSFLSCLFFVRMRRISPQLLTEYHRAVPSVFIMTIAW